MYKYRIFSTFKISSDLAPGSFEMPYQSLAPVDLGHKILLRTDDCKLELVVEEVVHAYGVSYLNCYVRVPFAIDADLVSGVVESSNPQAPDNEP